MNDKDRRKLGVPFCAYCGKPLLRVFESGGKIRCNECDESLVRKVGSDSSDGIYVKCPYCGYEGKELINPNINTRCPKCSKLILQTEINLKR